MSKYTEAEKTMAAWLSHIATGDTNAIDMFIASLDEQKLRDIVNELTNELKQLTAYVGGGDMFFQMFGFQPGEAYQFAQEIVTDQ